MDLTTGKRVGGISGKPVQSNRKALSPDGKYLALAVLSKDQTNEVEVWSLESGKRLSSFVADLPKTPMTILDFAGPGEVLTYTFGQQSGKFVFHLRVWDAQTGSRCGKWTSTKTFRAMGAYDISPGRNWLATVVEPEVVIYDLQTGQPKASITPPAQTEAGKSVHVNGFRFSPDGTEFVCMSDGFDGTVHRRARHGDRRSQAQARADRRTQIGPAKSGIVQRTAHRVRHRAARVPLVRGRIHRTRNGPHALELPAGAARIQPLAADPHAGRTDRLHRRAASPASCRFSPFPSDKLKKSMDAYRSDVPAIVKPGEKVKVTVKVGEVRFGKPDDAKQSIETVLAERLADDGLEVADDGSTAMSVQYKEKAGKTLQEVKGGSIRGGGVPTGRSIQSTAGEMVIKWTSKDGKTKIYEHTVNLDPSVLTIRDPGEVTDDKARQQVFAILKVQLASLPMPYFVPQDKALAVLPMTTSSEMASPLSPKDAMKKKIEAKKKKVGK